MKGIAPFIAAPQSTAKRSGKAKAGKTPRFPGAAVPALQAKASRTRFDAALREKLGLKPADGKKRAETPAKTKLSTERLDAPGRKAPQAPEAPEQAASPEKGREKEKAAARPEAAMLAASPARAEPASKPAGKLQAPAERKVETASGSAAPAATAKPRAAAAEAGQPRITVTDLRRKPAAGRKGEGAAEGADLRQAAVAAARKETRVEAGASEGDGTSKAARSVPWDPAAAKDAQAREVQAPAKQVPVESLRDVLPPELVKTAGIVVRDGDAGEIRLVLKPESLGSVRIRMSLGDGGIEGRIVVESQAVKEIFEGRLDELAQALRQEGFQNATLSVSVGGGDAGGRRREEAASAPSPRRGGEELERAVPGVDALSAAGDYRVNVMA